VRIGIKPEEIARLGDVTLVPGMPVEAFMKTYDRTVTSYLTKPLHDQISPPSASGERRVPAPRGPATAPAAWGSLRG
jgi:hypothetical protein